MSETKKDPGPFRRWLDRRREKRRRGAEIAQRAKAARRGNMEGAGRHGSAGSGDPGSFWS